MAWVFFLFYSLLQVVIKESCSSHCFFTYDHSKLCGQIVSVCDLAQESKSHLDVSAY